MSSIIEVADVRRALHQLRDSFEALRSRYGDVPAVRRVNNDLERLEIDIAELSTSPPAPRRGKTNNQEETVVVPDTPYDPSLWRDADDEGVGGQSHRP